MSGEQAQADEALRDAVNDWLGVHEREHAGEILGDLVVVAHFRSWAEDDTQVDDYEVLVPAGVSYHGAYGLLQRGMDLHVDPDEDEDG